MAEKEIGKISHYFSKIGVCVVEITNGNLKVGEKIRIKGATSDVMMVVDSMQVDHRNVDEANKGDSIGMKVSDKVREQDIVYKITT